MEEKKKYTGLTDAEVAASREKYGSNVLTPPEKEPLWKQFLGKFADPLIIVLLIAGALSVGISFYEFFGLQHGAEVFFEPAGIFVAILLATGLAFYFERQADKEFSLLNQVNDDEPVEVYRNGQLTQVPRRDIVVGDLIVINTGEEVAADGQLVEAVHLHMDESTLTGEPMCAKSTDPADADPNATYPTDHVMKGTKAMEGHGVMRVLAVGDRTEQGKVFEAAQIDDSVKTPLHEQLDGLAGLITKLSYACAALIIVGRLIVFFHWAPAAFTLVVPTALFFWMVVCKFKVWRWPAITAAIAGYFAALVGMSLWCHHLLADAAGTLVPADTGVLIAYILQTLMIAVTLIVVSVPEGLPMAVTLSLAYSMRRMLKTNNLVRKMHACETMGATTVICTDKTGTLTQNQMRVDDIKVYDAKIPAALMHEGLAVNSTAELDYTGAKPQVLGNPTEGALLLWLHDQGVDYRPLREAVQTVAELPFTTERKYMATMVRSAAMPGKTVLFVKGAPEIVFSLCATADVDKATLDAQLLAYQQRAMRTLGFAYQVVEDGDDTIADQRVTARRLHFIAIAAIADPVRAEVPDAVRECVQAGIRIKVVTGDTPGTAREIGRQIGLWTDADDDSHIITGPEFAALSDAELEARIMDLKIIARARPMDKKRLVETLQRMHQVVAVTGDGTNDAPALKAAHGGLSMGDGTSVAKEASDITIVDNSFSSIGKAVMWGRSLYQNIQRFLLFQLTVNVTACFIVLCGAFMGTESPLTVTQMLWINLIMDTFAAVALASLPPSEQVMTDKPRDRRAFILTRAMKANIIGVGGFFFLMLLALLYVFQHADICCVTDLFHFSLGEKGVVTDYELTLLFTIFVMTHFFYLFNARAFSTRRSALHFKGCRGLLLIAAIIMVGQVLMVELPGLQQFFNVTSMSLEDWVIVTLGSSLVLWVREAAHLVRRLVRK